MTRQINAPRDVVTADLQQVSLPVHQSERTLLLSTVLLTSAVSAATGFVLAQYFSGDVLSSLLYVPQDCWFEGINVGRHCFADYSSQVATALRPNPWAHFGPPTLSQNPYTAAAMAPFLLFGLLGRWLGSPELGLFTYLSALTVAVLTPALWAVRGARGLERIVVFVACGMAAIPAWAAVDRGNSTGFLVPIMLVFLIALRRRQWRLAAIMIILAALLKPHFAVLVVALFGARHWRLGVVTTAGIAIPNLAAYLLWPQDFPNTISQSIHNAGGYGTFNQQIGYLNISFAKALLVIPDQLKALQTGGTIPNGFLAGPRTLVGYGVLLIIVSAVLALGRRIPPVMVGVVLLATVSFFPAVTYRYYLVFVLPIAALVVRDPDGEPGSGLFDRLGDHRRAVGICVSLATALSIAHVVLPGPPNPVVLPIQPGDFEHVSTTTVFDTTAQLTPLLWLITCFVIIASYARRPASEGSPDTDSTAAGDRVKPPEPSPSAKHSEPEVVNAQSRGEPAGRRPITYRRRNAAAGINGIRPAVLLAVAAAVMWRRGRV
ncbi:glycosyltransferase family 87 protein [Mycobacterium asiaticum]|uniref:glycosyltransferase family 87 protein n=1 Tax=Mycobacterium asiaticum TaxID=1790 RepID=UPI0007EF2B15|nr:glycosyltransferase family 87 protein [Mycobacterium asiaticum]OBJ55171.1 hypothetical protein A9W94_20385 [Mycobacterium asiaticum]